MSIVVTAGSSQEQHWLDPYSEFWLTERLMSHPEDLLGETLNAYGINTVKEVRISEEAWDFIKKKSSSWRQSTLATASTYHQALYNRSTNR